MTSSLHLKTTYSSVSIRPSQREDIPRMHFTGVNMLILAQHPEAVQEFRSAPHAGGWVGLPGGDVNCLRDEGGQGPRDPSIRHITTQRHH